MSNNIKEDLALFNQIVDVFLESEQTHPVAPALPPAQLENKFNLSLNDEGTLDKDFAVILQKVVLNTPKTSSSLFFNQLFGGRHSKAVLGDLLAVLLNNSMATYKISGPQVGVEKTILKKVCSLVGYRENAEGTFPTGGSMSNFMSLVMARDKVDANIKNVGINQQLIAYSSENSHYSIAKNASFIGLGKGNVRYIKSNEKGEMCVADLQNKIKKDINSGCTPFYVNATAGTTVLGAFDSVVAISAVCKKYNIWLHLDGAFGGTVIFSEKYKHLIGGVGETDSFCFNAHKTLGVPLSSSILVVKDKRDLYFSFSNEASYLYQTHNEEYNLGQTSFECGRRNNALKFWAMWKAIGTKGIAKIVDHEFYLADLARDYVRKNTDYILYSFDDTLSICFNYKDYDPQDLCTKLYEHNKLMIGFGHFHDHKFVRLVAINGENTKEEFLNFFTILESFAAQNDVLLKRR